MQDLTDVIWAHMPGEFLQKRFDIGHCNLLYFRRGINTLKEPYQHLFHYYLWVQLGLSYEGFYSYAEAPKRYLVVLVCASFREGTVLIFRKLESAGF